jgi:hypothetical protein
VFKRAVKSPKIREETAVIHKALVVIFASAFVVASGASWAQVAAGGNTVPKYSGVPASKNKKVTNHGVGGNSAPSYPSTPASKNKKVTNHGVGGNSAPSYPVATKP